MTRLGSWIEAHDQDGSAFAIHPLDLHQNEIRIWACAHALSQLCRYGGHSRDFYSVAQHSVIVSYLVPPEHALCGLLHDLTEALGLVDVPAPVKRHLSEYMTHEHAAWVVVASKFGLPLDMPPEVEFWDRGIVATEKRDLLGSDHIQGWNATAVSPLSLRIMPVGPARARGMFLARFEELSANNGRAPEPGRARVLWNRARYKVGIRDMVSGVELVGIYDSANGGVV